MKNPRKKVSRNFRLRPEIDAELKKRSDETGITETRMVEDALKHYFAQTMQNELTKALKSLAKGFKPSNPNRPLTLLESNAAVV